MSNGKRAREQQDDGDRRPRTRPRTDGDVGLTVVVVSAALPLAPATEPRFANASVAAGYADAADSEAADEDEEQDDDEEDDEDGDSKEEEEDAEDEEDEEDEYGVENAEQFEDAEFVEGVAGQAGAGSRFHLVVDGRAVVNAARVHARDGFAVIPDGAIQAIGNGIELNFQANGNVNSSINIQAIGNGNAFNFQANGNVNSNININLNNNP